MIQNETFRAKKSVLEGSWYLTSDDISILYNISDESFFSTGRVKISLLPALSDICAKIQEFEAEQNITK